MVVLVYSVVAATALLGGGHVLDGARLRGSGRRSAVLLSHDEEPSLRPGPVIAEAATAMRQAGEFAGAALVTAFDAAERLNQKYGVVNKTREVALLAMETAIQSAVDASGNILELPSKRAASEPAVVGKVATYDELISFQAEADAAGNTAAADAMSELASRRAAVDSVKEAAATLKAAIRDAEEATEPAGVARAKAAVAAARDTLAAAQSRSERTQMASSQPSQRQEQPVAAVSDVKRLSRPVLANTASARHGFALLLVSLLATTRPASAVRLSGHDGCSATPGSEPASRMDEQG